MRKPNGVVQKTAIFAMPDTSKKKRAAWLSFKKSKIKNDNFFAEKNFLSAKYSRWASCVGECGKNNILANPQNFMLFFALVKELYCEKRFLNQKCDHLPPLALLLFLAILATLV